MPSSSSAFPFFLAFIGIARVIALGEGRLLEAITGERMPRRPVHPGPPAGWWARIGEMLRDVRTWTTLAYLVLMLPLGIVYFTVAVTGLAISTSFIGAPLSVLAQHFGWHFYTVNFGDYTVGASEYSGIAAVVLLLLGVLLLTLLMHLARGLIRLHAHLAKALLVVPGT